jgi:hypothetical protein
MKRFITIMMIAALVLAFTVPAMAADKNFTAAVYRITHDGQAKPELITDNIQYWVYDSTAGSDTLETIYSDSRATSMDNPVVESVFDNTADIDFWCTPTHTDGDEVKLVVVDLVGGFTAVIPHFNYQQDHTVIIDERPGVVHHLIWRTGAITANTTTDSGVDFNQDAMILTAFGEVLTIDASSYIQIGVGNDVDGLVNDLPLSTAGFPAISLANSGAYLDNGTNFYPSGYRFAGGSLNYAGSSATTGDTGVVNIHVLFSHMK